MILLLSNIHTENELTLLEEPLFRWKFLRQYEKGPIKEFIKYFPFVKLSNKEINNISCVYILNNNNDYLIRRFHGERGSSRYYILKSKNVLLHINYSNISTWNEIVKMAQTEKLVLYSPDLDKSVAKELAKIPSDNISLNLGEDFRPYPASVVKFTCDFPLIKKKRWKTVVYDKDQILLNLFQKKNHISISPESGFVLHVNTEDSSLAYFLISDLTGDRKIFQSYENGNLEGLNDNYEAIVVSNFDRIRPQKQSELWDILIKDKFDKKPIFIVGKDSEIIPMIKLQAIFKKLDPFDFKNIKMDFIKFLCYYYLKKKGEKGDFTRYLPINESYINKEVLFQADNFSILLEALNNNEPKSSLDFYDNLFLYRLLLQIEILNEKEKIKEAKSDNNIPEPTYIWKYTGADWEISYKYSEPILIRDVMGMFYIAKFLEERGEEISIKKIRENAGLSEEKFVTSGLNWLRGALTEAIIIIEEREFLLGLGNELSQHLRGIIKHRGFFRKENFCTWPDDPEKKWDVYCPKYYIRRKRGMNNLTGKKKN